jgi:hypothetical protein
MTTYMNMYITFDVRYNNSLTRLKSIIIRECDGELIVLVVCSSHPNS